MIQLDSNPNPFTPTENRENDSGRGALSQVPPQLGGFNFGAFLLSWVWAIGNNASVGLLALVPGIGFLVRFYLGFKGNELAWRHKRWDSVESFRRSQGSWAVAGLAIWGLSVPALFVVSSVSFPAFARAREKARLNSCRTNLNMLSLAAFRYGAEHGGSYPPGSTFAEWKPALLPYLSSRNFTCGASKNGEESYTVNPQLNGASRIYQTDPGHTWLFMDAQCRHYGKAEVVYCDGGMGEIAQQ